MVQTHGAAGDFVFAQGFPGAADRHAGQAMLDVQHGQDHQEQHGVDEVVLHVGVVGDAEELMERHPALFRPFSELDAEEGWQRRCHAVRAASQRQPVVEDQSDDFTEAQGHDRQVVTVQAQHREAEDAAGQARRDRRQRQHRPETQSQVLITERQAVGTDGVERHVTKVEQAGQADHDVQPQPQQHVDQPEDDHAQQVRVGEKREYHRDNNHQRDDPAQPGFVIRRQYMDPGPGGFKTLEDSQALGGLQEQAKGKTAGHDDGDNPGHPGRFQVEAVAVEDYADNRAEHNQGHQAGKNRVNQASFEINGFFSG
ncbi:hypothetical protein D3C71_1116650 [compost metagenome]